MLIRFIVYSFVLSFSLGAHAVCVSSKNATLRAGPGTKHRVTWVVPKYMPLIQLQTVGGWMEVEDQDGMRHWVSRRNVSSSIQCLSIRTQKASLRTGPGESFPRAEVWFADKYVPFKRVDIAENGWYEVEAYWGKSYWLSPDLVWRPVKIMDVSY